jgi:hypothetical protein
MARFDLGETNQLEHISSANGENINAKRVGLYGYDYANSQWRRVGLNSNGQTVAEVGTTPVYGRKAIAVTNTAVALAASSTPVKNGVLIRALAANTGKLYVGDASVTTGNGHELAAGETTSIAISDVSAVYINGTSGDSVSFLGAV